MFRGKNYKESAKLFDKQTPYAPQEAFDIVCKASKAKFDETVELHVRLGVDGRHADQQVRGATGFVGSDGKAVPLTDEEIVALGVERHEIVVGFEVGDTVKVTDGPLAGFSGIVEELETMKNRVRVVVSMFGRETPVDLELDQVEVVKE